MEQFDDFQHLLRLSAKCGDLWSQSLIGNRKLSYRLAFTSMTLNEHDSVFQNILHSVAGSSGFSAALAELLVGAKPHSASCKKLSEERHILGMPSTRRNESECPKRIPCTATPVA